jgi:PAS domain S-box-containing protein
MTNAMPPGKQERAPASQRLFETVLECMADGILVADVEKRRIQAANPAACAMLGCTYRQALQLTVEDIHPQEALSLVLREFERQVSREQSLARDIPVQRRDGSVFYADVNAFPLGFSGKSCLMGIFRDVTERKETEDRLRESEERYRTLVENAGEAITMIDRQGVLLFMNRLAAACLGGAPEDYVGQTVRDVFPAETVEARIASVQDVITARKGVNLVGLESVRGEQRWFNTAIEPVRDAGGKVNAALVIARDIHDLRQAREELEQFREKMARAEHLASLGTLSATIAHELTQPLTVSRLALQEALAELELAGCSPEAMEALRESLDGIADAASRVERFRNFARRSSKEAPTSVHIGKVVSRTVKLLEGKAHQMHMSLVVQNLDDFPPLLLDEKDMEQMCFALIENAVQAADGSARHQLVISASRTRQELRLRFEDDCGGIRNEHVDKIFQPFFTTKPPSEGTGLGLCIVERIVNQARGKIQVENTPDVGMSFCITLPLHGS